MQRFIQIDVDPAEINKNIMVDCSIIGDVREVLETAECHGFRRSAHDEWAMQIRGIESKLSAEI